LKTAHLVGFTIQIYHDARSHERQRKEVCGQTSHISCTTHGNYPGTNETGSWLVPKAGVRYFGEQKTSARIRTSDHLARSYSLY